MKERFLNILLNIIEMRFVVGFFKDKNWKSSRKSLGLFFGFYMFYLMITGDKIGVDNIPGLTAVIIVILYCLDAIKRETVDNFVNKLPVGKDKEVK